LVWSWCEGELEEEEEEEEEEVRRERWLDL